MTRSRTAAGRPGRGLLLVLAGVVALAGSVSPAPASAQQPFTAAAGERRVPKFFGGIVPDGARRAAGPRAHIAAGALPYQGGPVMHSNRTVLIFWEPSGSGLSFDPGYMALIERFLGDVAAASHATTNVYSLSGQYHDDSGPAAYASSYGGAVLDTAPLPANGCVEPPVTGPAWAYCLSDSQYESEIIRVIHADRLPIGPGVIYFMVTPDGLGSCEDSGPQNCALGGSASGSYCGYHSSTPDGEVLYALIPYNAVSGHCQSDNPRPNSSTADPTISTLSHEHNETVTDPLGNGWIDTQGHENGDLCITAYGGDLGGTGATVFNEQINGSPYYLQEEYSDMDAGCRPRARPDTAGIRERTVARGIRFTGRGSAPGARIASYDWFFSDGRTAHGATVVHRFGRAGRYLVGLRVVDSNGNYGYATSRVSVRVLRRAARRGS